MNAVCKSFIRLTCALAPVSWSKLRPGRLKLFKAWLVCHVEPVQFSQIKEFLSSFSLFVSIKSTTVLASTFGLLLWYVIPKSSVFALFMWPRTLAGRFGGGLVQSLNPANPKTWSCRTLWYDVSHETFLWRKLAWPPSKSFTCSERRLPFRFRHVVSLPRFVSTRC